MSCATTLAPSQITRRHATFFGPSHVAQGTGVDSCWGAGSMSMMGLAAIAQPVALNVHAWGPCSLGHKVIVELGYQASLEQPASYLLEHFALLGEAVCLAEHASLLGTTEMARALKEAGMPISGLADMMGVERKTVYAWLDGTDARSANLGRLETLYGLLGREEPGLLRFIHRQWDRVLDGGVTLHSLLTAEPIDVVGVRTALDALRPGAIRVMERDRKRESEGLVDGGPPGLANLSLTATLSG